MKLYHFVSAEHGLTNISRRHIKASLITELNDPFELSAYSADATVRAALAETREELSKELAILCFSETWQNPVQWSHYADRHRGFCLGFDIPCKFLMKVNYTDQRLTCDESTFRQADGEKRKWMRKMLTTKYSHWSYEKEVRQFVRLKDCCWEREIGRDLYFSKFSQILKLKEVILGGECKLSVSDVFKSIGNNDSKIKVFKARLSPKEFEVTD